MGFLVLFFVDVRDARIRRRLLLDKEFQSLSEMVRLVLKGKGWM